MSALDYSIGSEKWNGLSKLIEECGEVVQVGGKIIATGGNFEHWDGTNLRQRIVEEMGDVHAAIRFLIEQNDINISEIVTRSDAKLKLFRKWNKEQKEKS